MHHRCISLLKDIVKLRKAVSANSYTSSYSSQAYMSLIHWNQQFVWFPTNATALPTNSRLLPQINITLSVGHCTRASEEGFALLCQVLDFHWVQPRLHGADRHSWPCPFPPTSTLTVSPPHLVWPSLGEAVTHTKPWIVAKNNLSRKGGGLYGTDAEGGRVVQLGRAEGKTTEHFGSTAHFSANQMQGSSCCTRGLCTSCKTPPLFASGAEQQFCPFNLTNK